MAVKYSILNKIKEIKALDDDAKSKAELIKVDNINQADILVFRSYGSSDDSTVVLFNPRLDTNGNNVWGVEPVSGYAKESRMSTNIKNLYADIEKYKIKDPAKKTWTNHENPNYTDLEELVKKI